MCEIGVQSKELKEGWRDVCVRLLGATGGRGTCIIDLLLEASCTQGGIKMIHDFFPEIIPVILRYQTAVFCSWHRGVGPHPHQQILHTKQGQEFFHRG